MTKTITIDDVVAHLTGPDRPKLFKGSLIDHSGDDVCYCAQGYVLHLAGWDDNRLHNVDQFDADLEVAKTLNISRAHSVLLRQVNDGQDGCPEDVLSNPEKILGDQAPLVLAFWRHLDGMTAEQWSAARSAARAAAGPAAGFAAGPAARAAAWTAARDAAGDAARDAAGDAAWATNEIQGAEIIRKQGKPFFFLPMFGISDPKELEDARP